MEGKRPSKSGSFAGGIDEVIKHFPGERPNSDRPRRRQLDEKRDIHAMLFEQAWKLEEGR